jgi:hypothetical protein
MFLLIAGARKYDVGSVPQLSVGSKVESTHTQHDLKPAFSIKEAE